MSPEHRNQFLACLGTLFHVPGTFAESEECEDLFRKSGSDIEAWLKEFYGDLHGSRRGYPLVPVRSEPELEDRLLELASSSGLAEQFRRRESAPTLCLTHDVDNLRPTLQMRLKRTVAQRRLSCLRGSKEDYLESLETMLAFDQEVVGRPGVSTVFVACKAPARSLTRRAAQWLIDPSYGTTDPDFLRLLDLLRRYGCEVGIHGSFFSIEEGLLSGERDELGTRLEREVIVGRQHWLNLPGRDSLERVWDAGIRVDSTLGWNGVTGFRCGMARPFPVLVGEGKALWEVPLVLMDGPMFDDQGLDTDSVVELSKKILTQIRERNGCVAVGWHGRAASSGHNWFDAYRQIIDWAKAGGRGFTRLSGAAAGMAQDGSPDPTSPDTRRPVE